jgi:hypothetical protein
MKKLLSTVAFAALALAGPAFAQESTTGTIMLSGPGTTCLPSTTAATTPTTTDTTASTTTTTDTTGATTGTTATTDTTGTATTGTTATGGAASSTMALSAENKIDATVARTALTNSQTNVEKLASIGAPTTVCLVDLDTLAASDEALKGDIAKFQANNAPIKSVLEANSALLSKVQSLHPTFDVNTVRAIDIGPRGEFVLYVIKGA